ncbi:hypothetical protein FQR65_LT12999 [Abscondita terminalis]|nr:hypothetical protein FQR65_LT12999 [Abscondita terminalis]
MVIVVTGVDMKTVTVVAGTIKLDSGGVRYKVVYYLAHENYNSVTIQNDIAVILVNPSINFSLKINKISLRDSLPIDGASCTASGWGLTSYPSTTIPNDLQRIQLTKISLTECRANLTEISVLDSNACTLRAVGYGVCKGDSGGPLRYGLKQIGVVSFGILCARGRPDVYASVPFFKP